MQDLAERRPGFAVVDLETTGFAADRERIVEVAVVLVDVDGTETDAFCTLLDPGRDPGPTHIHGIAADMVAGAPTFGQIHPHLADLLSGRVVVGHNIVRFDLPFLLAECRRLGGDALVPAGVIEEVALPVPDPAVGEGDLPERRRLLAGPGVLDTLAVAQDHLGLRGKARLLDCCDRYGLTWDDHHSALGDARVTAALFGAMRDELGDDALGLDARLDAARQITWPGAAAGAPAVVGRALTV